MDNNEDAKISCRNFNRPNNVTFPDSCQVKLFNCIRGTLTE